MHTDWRAFLESRGARVDDDGSVHFDHADADPGCALVDLSHLGLVDVTGPEAEDFLQGQVSNDLRELTDSHTQLSSHCNPKGRMLANFRVLRGLEGFSLLLPRSQIAPVVTRLRMYLLRRNAAINDISDTLACFGVIGTCADAALQGALSELPQQPGDMVRAEGIVLIRIPGAAQRFLIITTAEQAASLWDQAESAGAQAMNADLWALHDIRAGIPTVLRETADTFVPQMANMHLIDGVSFHKGCYSGQEVIARMQYLGKLKRRMYLASATLDPSTEPPKPGAALSAPGSTSEQGPGRVVDARATAPGQWQMLVVAEISAAEGGELRLGDEGPVLEISDPPYGFPAEV